MVNIFVPYADIEASVASLDMARLGKQRVETLQIMNILCDGLTKKGDPYKGYLNHPAVRMWRGHEGALLNYQRATVAEWEGRPRESGKPAAPDTCLPQSVAVFDRWIDRYEGTRAERYAVLDMPWWWGDESVHESHRSKLMEKDYLWYGPQFASITREGLDYVWPKREET